MRLTEIARYPKAAYKAGPKAPFARKGTDFNTLFVQPQKQRKAWDGQDKDAFFRDKYAHVHAKQLKQRQLEQKLKEEKLMELNKKVKEEKPSLPKGKPDFHAKLIKKLQTQPKLEYIYGTNAVKAVLKNRKCQKLYSAAVSWADLDQEIREVCRRDEVPVVCNVPMQHLQSMSSQGVHNKVIVETEKLELPVVNSLEWTDHKLLLNGEILRNGESLSKNEMKLDEIKKNRKQQHRSFPVGLYIDQVTDTHNMGALLRSALWFGVDFVAFSSRNSAPLSPAVVKASSGASEFLKILEVPKPLRLFESLKAGGWSIVASAPNQALVESHQVNLVSIEPQNLKQIDAPMLLVVGSEGDGIRTSLLQRSTHSTTLRTDQSEVDSLNVSVATALLLSRITE